MHVRDLFEEAVNQAYNRHYSLADMQKIVEEEYKKVRREWFKDKLDIFFDDLPYRGFKLKPKAKSVYKEFLLVYYDKYADNKKAIEMRRELVERTGIRRENALHYETELKKIIVKLLKHIDFNGRDSADIFSTAVRYIEKY